MTPISKSVLFDRIDYGMRPHNDFRVYLIGGPNLTVRQAYDLNIPIEAILIHLWSQNVVEEHLLTLYLLRAQIGMPPQVHRHAELVIDHIKHGLRNIRQTDYYWQFLAAQREEDGRKGYPGADTFARLITNFESITEKDINMLIGLGRNAKLYDTFNERENAQWHLLEEMFG